MVSKRWYALILLTTLALAIISYVVIDTSMFLFFSWILIGFWICFSLYFIQRIKSAREFRSPHNTSFFIFGSLFVGIVYSAWSQYTPLLAENLLTNLVYLRLWTVLFGLPYALYGIFLLYSCFRRYTVVYVGQKAFNARKFGTFSSILTAIIGIYFVWMQFASLVFLLLGLASVFFIIVFGIITRRSAIPDVSTVITNIRRRTSNTRSNNTSSTTNRTPTTTRRRRSTTTTRTRTTPPTTRTKKSTTKVKPKTRKKTKRKPKKPKMSTKFKKLRPKAGLLSLDDFKCIFCFQDFKPGDKGRGIILCPHCRYPAHADEFKDWLESSTRCSRCDATIPAGFRRKPKVISVKDYVEIIKEFKKKRMK